MPDDRELKVGLIGFGLAGSSFHAPLIDAASNLSLAAIVTSNPERAAQAEQSYPDAEIYGSPDALWQNAHSLDLIVIASPNRFHKPLAMAAMKAGLAVVVDKPLCATAEDGRELIAEAQRRGVMLSVFHNRRWDGDFLTLQRLLKTGELGEIRRFESRFERWRPEPKSGWRQSGGAEDAGGVLYDLGAHLIDQALVLFGPVETVYAELDYRYPDAEVDDDSFIALTHRNGVRSQLWMSSVAAHSGPRMRALGSKAAFVSSLLDGQETALRDGNRPDKSDWLKAIQGDNGALVAGDDEKPIVLEPGAYLDFYEAVGAALREGSTGPVNPADAVAGLEIVAAARRSSELGQVISLTPADN
ncbi:Gfo/Idh/MocA family protein [Marinobacter sp. 1Y8]